MAMSWRRRCIHQHLLLTSSFIVLLVEISVPIMSQHSLSSRQQQQQSSVILFPNKCGEKCGSLGIPFPFYVNPSCGGGRGSLSDAFHLSCSHSNSLFLNISSSTSYRVLRFFPDGVLVDLDLPDNSTIPTTFLCRPYSSLSFGFKGNDYFGISIDNVVGLYDCKNSSSCKSSADCRLKIAVMPGCGGGNPNNAGSVCCYPLSDQGVWHPGEGLASFSRLGCRGFSCWVADDDKNIDISGRGSSSSTKTGGKRGVKLEWAVPISNSTKGACAAEAYIVNATTIPSGMRCHCRDGFVGDGFALGVGCLKSCVKDGKEIYGEDCYAKRHGRRKIEIVAAGIVASALTIASLAALFCVLRLPVKLGTLDMNNAANTRGFDDGQKLADGCARLLFTYNELEEATKGFDDSQKLADGGPKGGTLHAGVLGDGSQSHIAVHRVLCENEDDLIQALSRVQVLSAVNSHGNMARLLGCTIDKAGFMPLVVYEYYPANGTLEEYLRLSTEQKTELLNWSRRLNIAAEIAGLLAFLQLEISPPIFHHCLLSGCIFLDQDFSPKIAAFGLLGSASSSSSDVYDLGLVLLELISGVPKSCLDLRTMAPLQNIESRKIEEIVDPLLYYHEQPGFCREQIERVADLTARCLLFGGDGNLGMIDVARELAHIKKESVEGGASRRGHALEETFSNSSLLQMISMSPDSIHVSTQIC